MINKVFLLGNLGRDPQVRSAASGTPVAKLSLATNRRWRDADGKSQEQTEWHSAVCFGRTAEVAGQYLTRGRLVFVEGRLQTRSWEDRESGQVRYRTEIVVERLQLLGQRGGGAAHGSAPSAGDDLGPEPEDDHFPF